MWTQQATSRVHSGGESLHRYSDFDSVRVVYLRMRIICPDLWLKCFILQQVSGRRKPKKVSADFICGHVRDEIVGYCALNCSPTSPLFPSQIVNTKTRFTTGAQTSSTGFRERRTEFKQLSFISSVNVLSVIDYWFYIKSLNLIHVLLYLFVV